MKTFKRHLVNYGQGYDVAKSNVGVESSDNKVTMDEEKSHYYSNHGKKKNGSLMNKIMELHK